MTNETLALLISGLGLGGAIVAVIQAFAQRRKVGADATSVLTAAARDLVGPISDELAKERRERHAEEIALQEVHTRELAIERAKVAQVRSELTAALEEARELRGELAMARVEADELRRDREEYRARIRRLERQLNARPSN